ncbi:polysaccharide transporter, PST family [Noviherbaspirillum humi]|uniref:Polysaccharide transporter, PST family n=1 Tax=Noviherbaspirillum humi TaxID=1688639 RepID=A0A239GVF3_9BURK|nr:MOP flippase family protein [Noviherbaspirillum humi]SNS73179.1 polysaccharide transporter, PST family [Noviherbaspirillum humi]
MRIVTSVRWAALSQASRVIAQLISVSVLSRILAPESYGLMSIAMTVTNLAFLFRDLGTSATIIQRKELTERMKSTVYWCNVALGCSIGLLLVLLAYPIALIFKDERLAPIMMALAIVFPIASLSLLHQALLERESDFRLLARIEIVSSISGIAIALFLAYRGAGIWSLVMQMIGSTIITVIQLRWANRWRARLVFSKEDLLSLFGFGGNFSLFQFVIYLEQNADSMIIGRLLGPGPLGIYSMAYKIMLFPLQNLTAVISRALFPAFSRKQDSIEEIANLYLRAVRIIAMATAPLMAGMFFLRAEFVAILFGPQWSEVANILKWLAPVGFLQAMTASTGVVFLSLGRARLMLMFGILGAFLQISAFLIGVHWGIEGVAACYLVAIIINFLPCFCCVARLLKIPFARLVIDFLKPLVASAVMLLALYEIHQLIMQIRPSQLGFVAINVMVGALIYGVVLLVFLRQDISDIRSLAKFG